MKNQLTTREILITAIMNLAGDEYETSDDLIKMAKKSEQELVSDIIHIANYYKDLNDQ